MGTGTTEVSANRKIDDKLINALTALSEYLNEQEDIQGLILMRNVLNGVKEFSSEILQNVKDMRVMIQTRPVYDRRKDFRETTQMTTGLIPDANIKVVGDVIIDP